MTADPIPPELLERARALCGRRIMLHRQRPAWEWHETGIGCPIGQPGEYLTVVQDANLAERMAAFAQEYAMECTTGQAAQAREKKLHETLAALTKKLRQMEKPLNAALTIAHVHGFPYAGPFWEPELSDAKETLKKGEAER